MQAFGGISGGRLAGVRVWGGVTAPVGRRCLTGRAGGDSGLGFTNVGACTRQCPRASQVMELPYTRLGGAPAPQTGEAFRKPGSTEAWAAPNRRSSSSDSAWRDAQQQRSTEAE